MTATSTAATPEPRDRPKPPPRLTLERARRIVRLLNLDGGGRGD